MMGMILFLTQLFAGSLPAISQVNILEKVG